MQGPSYSLKRVIVALASGLVAFIAISSVAAALSLSGPSLGAGDASVAKCDTDGINVDSFGFDTNGRITSAEISGISNPTCVDGQLTIHLTDSANASIGSGGPVAVTGESVTVAITGLPSPFDVKHEVIIIVGP